MLHIKKSKDLDLRRFGKNTYQEDIQDAGTKGYNEGYQEGYETGYEEGGGGSSTECGLADALTKFCAWDSQGTDVDSNVTHFKPDAFIVSDRYSHIEGVVQPDGNFRKADGEDYYVVDKAYGGSSEGPTYFYTWDELNASYEHVVSDWEYHSNTPNSRYLYSGNTNVNQTIIPLYKKSTIDTQAAGVLGELYVPQIRVNEGGTISSAKEYYDSYTQSTVSPTFTAVTLMAETQEGGETVQTMYYMWLPIYN